MNETIKLMNAHTSVRRFTDRQISDEELKTIINAGRAASSWKNFQSYSIVTVRSLEKKKALFDIVPQEAIIQSSVFLLFVGDLNRAEKGVKLHTADFYSEGIESLLISSVDAGLAGQNTLLAAESLGYGGVIIGMVRHFSKEIAELFCLPDYTYPIFGIALGSPDQHPAVKPRLPYETVVFEEEYQVQDQRIISAYDQVQADYAGERAANTWSERLAEQFGQQPNTSTQELLKDRKLL